MLLLAPVVLSIWSIAADGLLHCLVREWSQLLNSNDCDISPLELIAAGFKIVVKLAITEQHFFH